MKPWEIDVNVLIIFFVRDDVLEKTFASVQQARPRRLLLWQDGAREGRPDDVDGIERCRKIVENIDWDCEVYKNYQTKNWGCDPSTFYSHKWAFSLVDKCIVLEDDCVPNQSFFTYCKELLDKYENDMRVNRICGMNNLGQWENCPDDYFFSVSGSVWGWATWKRVADLWDETYSCLNDSNNYYIKLLMNNPLQKGFAKYLKLARQHASTNKPHWESVQTLSKLLNSSFDIIPKYNMIRNVGVNKESTHSVADIRLVPKKIRAVFYEQKVYELTFPLKHPKYMIENIDYRNVLKNKSRRNLFTRIESILRRLIYGDMQSTIKILLKKLVH